MSSQEEYGVGDSTELVPGGLRVYRHYRITSDGALRPTTTGTDDVRPGVNEAVCRIGATGWLRGSPFCDHCHGQGIRVERRVVRIPSRLTAEDYFLCDDWYLPTHTPYEEFIEEHEVHCECITDNKCNAPEIKCTCGFYASYSPTTNFFAGSRAMWWGVPRPPIFAAVEASGRVLMGSKGVRSEKMEVKALVIDISHAPDPYEQMRLRDLLACAADRYDVPQFGLNKQGMIRAFPQPDLSNLLKNQES